MEVVNVLHMKGGNGVASYANNSSLAKKALLNTKPIIEEAIVELYCKLHHPKSLSVADLGCASGPNTLLFVSHFVETIQKTCKREGKESPEFQIYLNDLPSNDFNTIFKSLPSYFRESLRKEMIMEYSSSSSLFFNGVPGSFYGRLFLANSLHFVHSCYSLHWLSQVPNGVEDNKGNICVSSTSPPTVLKAYYEQFERDFCNFLKSRWVELVVGGRMFLTFLGRMSEDPRSKGSCYIWEPLARALNDMVLEGIIEEKEVEAFNIPNYPPSIEEVKSIIENGIRGHYRIDYLNASEVSWRGYSGYENDDDDDDDDVRRPSSKDYGYHVSKCIRTLSESLLSKHFSEEIFDDLFQRYTEIASDIISKERPVVVNITVAVAKIMNPN